MAYYFFDRCPDSNLDELAELCKEIGLLEVECSSPEREWHTGSSKLVWLVRYTPSIVKTPLLLQTMPGKDYKDEAILNIMKRMLKVSKSSQIYEGIAPKRSMDMAQFM